VIALKLRELVFRLGPRSKPASVLRHELLLRLACVASFASQGIERLSLDELGQPMMQSIESAWGLVFVCVH
jgi:hypothetical protein